MKTLTLLAIAAITFTTLSIPTLASDSLNPLDQPDCAVVACTEDGSKL